MQTRPVLLLALLALLAHTAAAAAGWRRLPEPENLGARGEHESNPMLPLLFAVHLPRMEQLATVVADRTNPASPNFRKWLSEPEMMQYASAPETTASVMQTLREQGAVDVEPIYRGAYVRAIIPRRTVEGLFEAPVHPYINDADRRILFRAEEHVVPAPLRGRVTHVLGYADFPSELRRLACPFPGETCPSAARDAYTVSPTVPDLSATMVIFNDVSSGEAYNAADRAAFLAMYAPTAQVSVEIVGPNTGSDACGGSNYNCAEAGLDVQTASAVLGRGKIIMYMSTGVVGQDSLFDFFAVLQTMVQNNSLVASISYGGDERANSQQYMLSMYYESIKAAAMGITILAASGDQGVQGFLDSCSQFSPIMPANIPYVVAVGATIGVESGVAEVTCSTAVGARITSGGGFSALFGHGYYQADVVQAYLASASPLPASSQYAANGRAYPDVSGPGRSFPVFIGGSRVYVDGTSGATPVVAAMFARINAELAAANRSSLGWAHPFLYSLPATCFNDVVSGSNRCGDATQVCCANGFTAQAGWDATTGLGSLNYPCTLTHALGSVYTAPASTPPTNSAAAGLAWPGAWIA